MPTFSQENVVNQDLERMLREQLDNGARVEEPLDVITAAVAKLPFSLPIGAGRGTFAYTKARDAAKRCVREMVQARFERDALAAKNRKQAERIAYLESLLGPEEKTEKPDDEATTAPRRPKGTPSPHEPSSLFPHIHTTCMWLQVTIVG